MVIERSHSDKDIKMKSQALNMLHGHSSNMEKQGISGYKENKKMEANFFEDHSQMS